MKHRVKTKQLGRNTKQRQALFKGLTRSLILDGSIVTTMAKAKAVQPIVDKLISRSRTGSLASRRQLHSFFGKRDSVNTMVDRVIPASTARVSGYTKITALGSRRGDNAEMAKLELVDKPEALGTLKKPEAVTATKASKAHSNKEDKASKSKQDKKPSLGVKAVVAKAEKATKANISTKKSGQSTRSITASKKK